MPAKDVFHNTVKIGLEKEGWEITSDPLYLDFGGFHSPFMRQFTEYAVG